MFCFHQTNLIWFAYLRLSLIAVLLGKSGGINTETVSSLFVTYSNKERLPLEFTSADNKRTAEQELK